MLERLSLVVGTVLAALGFVWFVDSESPVLLALGVMFGGMMLAAIGPIYWPGRRRSRPPTDRDGLGPIPPA